jgi:protein-S-isoprenylcysteine O-methyltransferase Ste14
VISADLVSAIVIASFAAFMLAAQISRARAVTRRGVSVRRARGIADAATYFFWLPYLVVWLRPGPSVEVPPPIQWIGLALAVGGVLFALWAMATLGRHYDLQLEVHGGHEVVRHGPYGVVRHPIYTGLAIHSLGAMLATGNLVFIAGTLAVTFPVFVLRARTEEALLRAELGADYDRYAADVPMLVPGTAARPPRTRRS